MELGQWNLAHWNFGELWRIGNKGINKGRSAVARCEALYLGSLGICLPLRSPTKSPPIR
jgi:hypothetical protein